MNLLAEVAMSARVHTAMVVLVVLFAASTAQAKGTTVQLTITGPGLDVPFHTSAKSVTSANVWSGNYIDWEAGPIEAAGDDSLDYRIHFWVKFPEEPIDMTYIVRYRWDDEAKRAIVCLPGERDPWYSVNAFSIVRGNEGSCFYADRDWGSAVRAAITNGR
jgi:hypothetical protein